MNAMPLDVYLVSTKDENTFLFRTESLFDALEMIRRQGLGTYLVLSQRTRHKRYYEVKVSGELVFREGK